MHQNGRLPLGTVVATQKAGENPKEVRMPYVLKNGRYQVRCRYPHCTFNVPETIDATLMGVTEEDVESEARKMARDMGMRDHDAMHGRKHTLQDPEIRRVSGICAPINGTGVEPHIAPKSSLTREFRKGEVILKKGEDATTVCRVISGSAFAEPNPSHRYTPGDCFGAAALLAGHRRLANIISGAEGTRVAFYNLVELRRTDPRKARRLFLQVMEDALAVICELERSIHRYRKNSEKAQAV